MNKCPFYHKDTICYTTMPPRHETVERCYGTKDCEECTCGGNPAKCDFSPELRKEASKMNTLEMMNEAQKTGKTYRADDMLFNYQKGFYGKDGKPWPGYSFTALNDLFNVEWVEKPENEMTKSEAEAKFNIKIIG